ncbi:MAG: hypothetical protein AB7I68_15655, partial [Porticoccaceae bacterium]
METNTDKCGKTIGCDRSRSARNGNQLQSEHIGNGRADNAVGTGHQFTGHKLTGRKLTGRKSTSRHPAAAVEFRAMARAPKVLVFDSGVGGLSVLAAV